MSMYRIGKLEEFSLDDKDIKIEENKQNEMKKDFENLRKLAIEMVSCPVLFSYSEIKTKHFLFLFQNLFKPNPFFYFLHGFHIILLYLLGFFILNKFGSGFLPVLCAFICQTVAKVGYKLNFQSFVL